MKRVYGSWSPVIISGILICFFLLLIGFCVYSSEWPKPLFFILGLLFPWFVYSFYSAFKPQLEYDEKGYRCFGLMYTRNFHYWTEVDSIMPPSFRKGGGGGADVRLKERKIAWLKQDSILSIVDISFRDYSSVLADVVQLVQSVNPEAKISPAVLAQVEKLKNRT